jgi:DNA-binding NarL/FixJ family response regulator
MNQTDCILIAIVEDDAEIAGAWERLLNSSPNVRCVGSYRSAEAAREVLLKSPVDVILMDVGLPGLDGIAFTREIKEKTPATEILVCTVLHDHETIFNALKAGAGGYILKSVPPAEMLQAIETIYSGGAPIDTQIARKVLAYFRPEKKAVVAPLTRREEEIISWVAKGYRNREIAETLHLSAETVRTHIRNIYAKLQANTRVEAVNKYFGVNGMN